MMRPETCEPVGSESAVGTTLPDGEWMNRPPSPSSRRLPMWLAAIGIAVVAASLLGFVHLCVTESGLMKQAHGGWSSQISLRSGKYWIYEDPGDGPYNTPGDAALGIPHRGAEGVIRCSDLTRRPSLDQRPRRIHRRDRELLAGGELRRHATRSVLRQAGSPIRSSVCRSGSHPIVRSRTFTRLGCRARPGFGTTDRECPDRTAAPDRCNSRRSGARRHSVRRPLTLPEVRHLGACVASTEAHLPNGPGYRLHPWQR